MSEFPLKRIGREEVYTKSVVDHSFISENENRDNRKIYLKRIEWRCIALQAYKQSTYHRRKNTKKKRKTGRTRNKIRMRKRVSAQLMK
jgi:hypothetical protein